MHAMKPHLQKNACMNMYTVYVFTPVCVYEHRKPQRLYTELLKGDENNNEEIEKQKVGGRENHKVGEGYIKDNVQEQKYLPLKIKRHF